MLALPLHPQIAWEHLWVYSIELTVLVYAYWWFTERYETPWQRFTNRVDFAFLVSIIAVIVVVLWRYGFIPHTYAFFYSCYYTCYYDYGVVWGGQLVDWWGDFINWI